MTSCTKSTERRAYDEKLRHFSDTRIALDLDYGNCVLFGDLDVESKACTEAAMTDCLQFFHFYTRSHAVFDPDAAVSFGQQPVDQMRWGHKQ